MVRNLSIRSRILAVLALPVLVLVVVASVLSWNGFTAARDAAQLQRAVDAARTLPALVAALDAERTAATDSLAGGATSATEVEQTRSQTDPLLQQVTDQLRSVDTSLLGEEPARAVAAAVDSARQVSDVRAVVDQGRQSPTLVSAQYEAAIGAQTELPAALALDAVPGSAAADALQASTALQQLVGLLADERDVGSRALANNGGVDSAERTSLVGIAARIATTRADAVDLSRSAGVQIPPPGVVTAQLRVAVEGDDGAGFPLPSVQEWRDALDSDIAALAPSAQAVAAAGADGVAQEASSARTTALLVAAGALAAVVVPLLIALLIARGITEPLRALTRAAGDVRSRLPRLVEAAHGTAPGAAAQEAELQPIPVRSRDEVGRLAAAFNEVNATSVRVAREQAALRASIASTFVTVARRDQALLNRQLTFIDTLERAEEDPQTLEELFTLDHLATRMRRNAESLLVLAGIESGRRLRAPMALSDVVRTASSEIEDYRRVDLALGADPAVLGHLALPAAHLLAELLENATRSSDPSTRVRVATSPTASGVLLTVSDEGIGMTPEQRAEVASRLADPSASAAVGASELGYFVVGRIARRLGARVEVHDGAPRGTVVAVALPTAAFAGAVEAAGPAQAAARPALTERVPATGALPVVRLPETRPADHQPPARPAAPADPQPVAASAAGTPATTTGGLPRRAPRAAQAAAAGRAARTAAADDPAAAPAPAVAPAAAEQAAAVGSDAVVARRSAVFRSFTARRGVLEPTAAPPVDQIDLTALRSPLGPARPAAVPAEVPAEVRVVDLDASPYVPDRPERPARSERPAPAALPARAATPPTAPAGRTPADGDGERGRGVHAGARRGLFGLLTGREAGERTTGQQAVVPAAAPGVPPRAGEVVPVAEAGAAVTARPAADGPETAEVRPMTRRELRALEASGQLPAVRTGGRAAVRPATRPAARPAPAVRPAARPATSAPVAPPLVPEPVVAALSGSEAPFTPVPAAAQASPSALPRRSTAPTGATPATGASSATGGAPATGTTTTGWLAQPAAPLRPLPPMPSAPAAGAPGGRPLALAMFETGEIPREAYRPAAVSTGSSPLVRRTGASAAVPARSGPASARPAGGPHPPRRREPAEVRSMLAGYASGVSRGRRAPVRPEHDPSHAQSHAPETQEER